MRQAWLIWREHRACQHLKYALLLCFQLLKHSSLMPLSELLLSIFLTHNMEKNVYMKKGENPQNILLFKTNVFTVDWAVIAFN